MGEEATKHLGNQGSPRFGHGNQAGERVVRTRKRIARLGVGKLPVSCQVLMAQLPQTAR